MKTKVVIIGAGSASFTAGILRDLVNLGETIELGLVDLDPLALETAERLALKMVHVRKAPITITSSLDRREVLEGATAVVSTIAVGGRRARERDVFIPRKYDVFQSVGDTVMPGGASRALRMIPAMVEIAQDVLALAPQALFVNYANPMTALCRAIRRETGAEIIGLCHGLIHRQRTLASWLELAPATMNLSYGGLNHLTWVTDICAAGESIRPKLQELANNQLALLDVGFSQNKDTIGKQARDQQQVQELDDLVPATWQLFDLFGALPVPFDRHVVEFFPWLYSGPAQYFGCTLGINAFNFEKVIHAGDQTYAQIRDDAYTSKKLPDHYFTLTDGEEEQFVDILDARITGSPLFISANLPNNGRIPGLPEESIIEAPARVDAEGITPLTVAPLPTACVTVLAARLHWIELIIEAAMEGSREKFVQALLLDGAVKDLSLAQQMADELLAAQQDYLPQFHSSFAPVPLR
jgi:alpha-galactosidase